MHLCVPRNTRSFAFLGNSSQLAPEPPPFSHSLLPAAAGRSRAGISIYSSSLTANGNVSVPPLLKQGRGGGKGDNPF